MRAITTLTLGLAAAALAVTARADFHDHLGLQMWSLRAQTKDKGMPFSLDLVKGWGMTEVEGGVGGGQDAAQFRAELDKRGLTSPGVHAGYEALTKDLDGVIRDAKIVGATYVFCPWIPHEGAFDAATMKKAAADFNRWGEAMHAAGIHFGYHPHGYEFSPGSAAGETLLDDLIHATKPEYVGYEMDVFWIIHGGGDPVKLLEKYPGRWLAMHVKDMRGGIPVGLNTGHAQDIDNVTVGKGRVDWKAVLGAAQKVGVKYYFIEDETPAPLECVPKSYAYLKGLKL